MSGLVSTLRAIHRHRKNIRDLREQLKKLPLQEKVCQARLTARQEELKKAQEDLKKLKVKVLELESALKTVNQQIAKYEKQKNDVESKKEFDALESEIEQSKKKRGELEDEILNGLTEIDERTAKLPDFEQAVQAAKAELEGFAKTMAERQGNLNEQIKRAEELLRQEEEKIPAKYREQYTRIVKGMDADGFSLLQDRFCSACSTEVTNQNRNDLLQDRLVFCQACSRMLYLPEESPTPA